VDFVLRFLESLGISECVPIGHSHGGRIILNWLSRPVRPVEARKCILCAAAGIKPRRGAGYYLKVYSYKTAKLLLKPFPALLSKMRESAGSADYRAASPVMRNTLTRVVNEDYSGRLANIRAETLLIWGDADTATPPSDGRTMEQNIPGAGLAMLKGAGHYAIFEQSGRFCRIFDAFL
jgi:pimeloyl-ACP methyl ester carboxylesterase